MICTLDTASLSYLDEHRPMATRRAWHPVLNLLISLLLTQCTAMQMHVHRHVNSAVDRVAWKTKRRNLCEAVAVYNLPQDACVNIQRTGLVKHTNPTGPAVSVNFLFTVSGLLISVSAAGISALLLIRAKGLADLAF